MTEPIIQDTSALADLFNVLHKLTKTLPETLAKPMNLNYTTNH